jgi:hypothetical protein
MPMTLHGYMLSETKNWNSLSLIKFSLEHFKVGKSKFSF